MINFFQKAKAEFTMKCIGRSYNLFSQFLVFELILFQICVNPVNLRLLIIPFGAYRIKNICVLVQPLMQLILFGRIKYIKTYLNLDMKSN